MAAFDKTFVETLEEKKKIQPRHGYTCSCVFCVHECLLEEAVSRFGQMQDCHARIKKEGLCHGGCQVKA